MSRCCAASQMAGRKETFPVKVVWPASASCGFPHPVTCRWHSSAVHLPELSPLAFGQLDGSQPSPELPLFLPCSSPFLKKHARWWLQACCPVPWAEAAQGPMSPDAPVANPLARRQQARRGWCLVAQEGQRSREGFEHPGPHPQAKGLKVVFPDSVQVLFKVTREVVSEHARPTLGLPSPPAENHLLQLQGEPLPHPAPSSGFGSAAVPAGLQTKSPIPDAFGECVLNG